MQTAPLNIPLLNETSLQLINALPAKVARLIKSIPSAPDLVSLS